MLVLEAINVGVAIQTPGHKTKSDDSIAPDKVSKIADQKVRPDREIIHDWGIKENGKIKEEKNVEDGQKEEKEVQVSQVSQVSQDLLDDLEDNINTIHNVGLQFSMHEESGRTIVKVIEKDTGNLIRQIPPEEILDLAVRMNEVLGIFFDKRV